MTQPETSALDALAARARAALAQPVPGPDPAAEPEPVTGTAADGLVRAVVGADGRLRSLTIDPALHKQPLSEITAAARTAINAALENVAREPDYAPVVDLVRQTQAQVRSDLGRVSTSMAEVAQQVRNRPQGGKF